MGGAIRLLIGVVLFILVGIAAALVARGPLWAGVVLGVAAYGAFLWCALAVEPEEPRGE